MESRLGNSSRRDDKRHQRSRSRSLSEDNDRGDTRSRRRRSDRSRSRSRERDRGSTRDRDRDSSRNGGSSASRGQRRNNVDDDDHKASSRYAGMTGAQIERARAKERMLRLARLSRDDYSHFKEVLSEVSLSRLSIKKAMGFAFDKIESAEEVL